jgi:hypothetical protein
VTVANQARLAAFATLLVASTAAAQGNLVVNGGFETGSLSPWTAEGPLSVDGGSAHEGSRGVRLDGTGRLLQAFATVPGRKYFVSARLRLDAQSAPPAWGGLRIVVFDAAWQAIGAIEGLSGATLVAGAWQRLDFGFTATTTLSRIGFENFSGGGVFTASADAFIVSDAPVPADPPDTAPPQLSVGSPVDGLVTAAPTITFAGQARDASGVVRVEWSNERGGSGTASGSGEWSAVVPLASGVNRVTISATDRLGNTSRVLRSVTSTLAAGTPPAISLISLGTHDARQHSRVEMQLRLQSTGTRPYHPFAPLDDGYAHPAGITLDAEIDLPDGNRLVVPAFYHVPYARARRGPSEALGVDGPADWRVRFTPTLAGRHSVRFVAVDAGGRTESALHAFDVAENRSRGFPRVSSIDSRTFVYQDGSSFVPIAEGRQWAPDAARASISYEEVFAQDAAAGVNLTRVWTQNDGYSLSLEGSWPRWEPRLSQFTQALGIDLSRRRSGARAARFSAAVAATEGYYQAVAVRPDTTYTLRGWIASSGLTGRAWIAADAESLLAPGPVRAGGLSGTRDWQLVESTFTTRPDQDSLGIWAGVEQGTGTAWFDDLELVPAGGAHNVIPDPGFERQFARVDRGNDPEDPATNRTVPKGTAINQWAAFQIDRILESAASHGLQVQLCSKGDVYWTWDATVIGDPYAQVNGHVTTWLDSRHLGYWKRNYRYRVARWGAFTSLLAWEVWNEHGNIPMTGQESDLEVARFYDELGRFIRALDPHRRPLTTSQGSQAFSAAFWASGLVDVANYHDYITTGLARYPVALMEDEVGFVYTLARGLAEQWPPERPRVPIVWGEFGTLVTWDQPDAAASTGEPGAVSRHNALWAGLFSPALTSPIDWQSVPKAQATAAVSRFFRGEPYGTAVWTALATSDLAPPGSMPVLATQPQLRVLALRSATGTRALGWVQHRDHTWARVARGSARTAAGGSITMPGMSAGAYTIEWWDTRRGALVHQETRAHAGGPLTAALPSAIDTDIAFKLLTGSTEPTAPRNLRVAAPDE